MQLPAIQLNEKLVWVDSPAPVSRRAIPLGLRRSAGIGLNHCRRNQSAVLSAAQPEAASAKEAGKDSMRMHASSARKARRGGGRRGDFGEKARRSAVVRKSVVRELQMLSVFVFEFPAEPLSQPLRRARVHISHIGLERNGDVAPVRRRTRRDCAQTPRTYRGAAGLSSPTGGAPCFRFRACSRLLTEPEPASRAALPDDCRRHFSASSWTRQCGV